MVQQTQPLFSSTTYIGALWPAAEKLAGRACDPLDEALLDRIEQAAR